MPFPAASACFDMAWPCESCLVHQSLKACSQTTTTKQMLFAWPEMFGMAREPAAH